MFDWKAIESGKLGYYVYALFDPKKPNVPFYIGKGSGNRVFAHANGTPPAEEGEENLLETKVDLIRDIKARGDEVVQIIVRHGLTDEDEAYRLEGALIDMVNTIHPGTLKNTVSGHGTAQSMKDTRDLIIDLNAEPIEPKHKLLIIKIEALWPQLLGKYGSAEDIPEDEIYAAVRESWKINPGRANSADCILAVARGLVRGVFVAEGWYPHKEYPQRHYFDKKEGEHPYGEYKGQSVTELFNRGNQNPIRYVGC